MQLNDLNDDMLQFLLVEIQNETEGWPLRTPHGSTPLLCPPAESQHKESINEHRGCTVPGHCSGEIIALDGPIHSISGGESSKTLITDDHFPQRMATAYGWQQRNPSGLSLSDQVDIATDFAALEDRFKVAVEIASQHVMVENTTDHLMDMSKEHHTLPDSELLPLSLIAKIVALQTPEGTKVAQHTKLFVQESVSEFMACVITEASDVAAQRGPQRMNISAADVGTALKNLGACHAIPISPVLPVASCCQQRIASTSPGSLLSAHPSLFRSRSLPARTRCDREQPKDANASCEEEGLATCTSLLHAPPPPACTSSQEAEDDPAKSLLKRPPWPTWRCISLGSKRGASTERFQR